MKKSLKFLFLLLFAASALLSYGQGPTVASGYNISQLAQGGILSNQILDGITADPSTGNVYVATVTNLYSSSFKLYKITPSGIVSYINEYNYGHYEVVKMAFSPSDGHIYTLDINSQKMYKINPNTGSSSVFASNMPGGGRYGLEFDYSGNLILSFESITTYYKVTSSGATSLGSISFNPTNGNHGDAFGIQPDGNYVVYPDCGSQNVYTVNTAGHVDGTNYTDAGWIGTTNIFSTLMPGGCGYSLGAIDPETGDIYSTIANFGSGNSRILFTEADGGATTLFVDNAGGIIDVCFGKETGNGSCNSMFFVDRNLNAVYEVPMNNCCSPKPDPAIVSGGGSYCGSTTITASNGNSGTMYFQGTTSKGTSTSNQANSATITASGTYFFRAVNNGCWGRQGSVYVEIKELPENPVISPGDDIAICNSNNTTAYTFSIPSSSYSDPITYNINQASLLNVPNSCGNGSYYGNGNVGFSWTDVGNGLVDYVTVSFSVGVECDNSTHNLAINNENVGTFNTNNWCTCSSPSNSQIITKSFSPTNYNVGGINNITMNANTFGFFPASSLNNYYAKVTVVYKAPNVLWTPGNLTTNSITVVPTQATQYVVSVTGGNGCSTNDTINVIFDNINPTAATQDVTIYLDANGDASITTTDIDNGSNDNCTFSLSLDKTDFDCSETGANTVTLTITDASGNTDTETATVMVVDNINPTAICQNTTVTLSNGSASITTGDIDNGSNDACGILSLSLDNSTFDCDDIGNNTVTMTVTDNNNNESTCTSTVTVVGTIPTATIASSANTSGTVIGGTTTYAATNQMFIGYGPQSMNIVCTPGGGSSFTYSWSGSGLSSTTVANPVFTPTQEGNYTLTCTVTNEYGCETTESITICVINAKGNGGNANNPKVLICHRPSGNPNNTQNISISVNAVTAHLGLHGGCTLGACGSSCSSLYSYKVGGEEAIEAHIYGESHLEVMVYPNPSRSEFNFILESPTDEMVSLKVYDIQGQLLIETNNLVPNDEHSFGTELISGVYMVVIKQGDFVKTTRVVKIN